MTSLRLTATALALIIASVAVSQSGRPAGGPPGTGGTGPGGGQRFDPAQQADQLMAGDANKDGKLAKDEVPGPFAERAFDRADANKDGFLDKRELTSFFQAGASGRGGQAGGAGAPPAGGPGAGAPPEGRAQRGPTFEAGMKQVARGAKALEKTTWDAASKDADLEAASHMQAGLATAKAMVAQAEMSEAAAAKFGKDQAAYRAELRAQLLMSLKASIAMEEMIHAGNATAAKAAFETLKKMESDGHKLFKAD
jgi:hypothetical protein